VIVLLIDCVPIPDLGETSAAAPQSRAMLLVGVLSGHRQVSPARDGRITPLNGRSGS